MATQPELNDLVARRRAAAEARKAAKAAPPTIEENPDVGGDLLENRAQDKAVLAAKAAQMSVQEGGGKLLVRPSRDLSREIARGDVTMPKLKISQAMSKVNTDDLVRQGNWYISSTNKNLGATVYIVPLDMQKSRTLFVAGSGVVCRSFDLVNGEGDPGLLCEGTEAEMDSLPEKDRGCPLRLWERNKETGVNTPPACGISYNYPVLILDPNDMLEGKATPAVLSLRSTASRIAKDINTIVTDGIMTEPVWHEVILRLSLEKRTNSKGTFYVPAVAYHDMTDGSIEKQAATMAASIRGSAILRRSIENDDTE